MHDGSNSNYPSPSPLQYHNGLWVILLCLKKSSFLHMCSCTMPHTFFYDGKFYFRLRHLIVILVWAQLCWLSRGGVTSKGRLSPKVLLHRRSSSTEGHLPSKVLLINYFHGWGVPPPFTENSAKIINLMFEPFPYYVTQCSKELIRFFCCMSVWRSSVRVVDCWQWRSGHYSHQSFPVFFPQSRPFLIEGVLGSKNLFSESCLERPKT